MWQCAFSGVVIANNFAWPPACWLSLFDEVIIEGLPRRIHECPASNTKVDKYYKDLYSCFGCTAPIFKKVIKKLSQRQSVKKIVKGSRQKYGEDRIKKNIQPLKINSKQ
jgi:hypothetical protein